MQNSIDHLIPMAIEALQGGFLVRADSLMQTALNMQPKHPAALEIMGIIKGLEKKPLEAASYFKKALKLDPNNEGLQYNLAKSSLDGKNFQDALIQHQKLVKNFPLNLDAWVNLGMTQLYLNSDAEAVEAFEECLKINPLHKEALINIGAAFKNLKEFDNAVLYADRALQIDPQYAEAWSNRGVALKGLKQNIEALASYEKALDINPGYLDSLINKGGLLTELQRYEEAIQTLDIALNTHPGNPEAWSNRGMALKGLKQNIEALASYEKALDINPGCLDSIINKGDLLTELKRYEEALSAYQQALALDPEKDYLYGLSVYIKTMICDWSHYDQQLLHIQSKLAQDKKVAVPFSLLALLDDEGAHLKAAKLFASDKFPESAILGPIPKRPSDKKIRIGYFSADFRNHPVASLIAELFELHDRDQFEIVGFSLGSDDADDMRLRLKGSFDQFIDICNQSDQEVAQLARDLKIDIAIDLGGYTQDCRTGIFAYRAAPIQVNYLGYPGTMGAPYIDYIIADDTVIPEANQQYYSEKVAYLPHTYQANDRKRKIADKLLKRADFDLPEQGFIFCCFNNNFKLTPSTLDSWARILKAVNGSVLWLYEGNEKTKLNLIKEFANRDLAPERLIFAKRVPPDEHLARYQLADLFIDTLPYNAHTTTSDALWAGTPVLTLTGNSFAGRVATSLLEAIEMPELITKTLQEYEDKAIDLARNPHELVQLKKKLQAKRDTTPLFNTPLFTKHIEAAYIAMYQRYQQDLAPETLMVGMLN